MASTYSTNLKIELQATGENSGTWGTITNTNLGTALEQAIVGYGNPNYASDANLTLTYTDTNAAQAARALVLNVTSGVSLTATRELVVPTIQKQYIVQNNTTGSQSITVKTSAGTGITVPNGRKAHLYVDGTNVIYMDDYVDINGGAIDGTPIGANSASTGAFSTLSATGNVNFDGGTFTFNDSGADKDFRVEGDTDANLFFSDASTDRIGIGTNTPATKLDVNGTITATAINTTTLDLTNLEVTNIKAKDGTAAITIADSTGLVTVGAGETISGGNLTFSSTGQRITGDMSNTTQASRLLFQTSTTNGTTNIGAIPNGTGTTAQVLLTNSSDPANASRARFNIGTSEAAIVSDLIGTGTYLPMTFYTGGSERMRLDTSGNLGLGTASPGAKLDINGITGWQGGTTGLAAQISGATSGVNGGGNLRVLSSTSATTDAGGAIALGGYYSTTSLSVDFASVIGAKENSTAGNTAGYFSIATRSNGGNNTERMRIDSSGNVGIGNTAANVNDQVGSVRPLLVSTSDSVTTIAGSKANIVIGNADTTTNNTSQLSFAALTGANTTYFAAAAINCVFGARTNGQYPTGQLVFSTSTSLNSAPTEKMRIDSSGNVGIGTTPSYRLHVAATAPTNSIIAYLTNSQGGSTRSRIALQDASTTFAPDLGSVGNNITFDTVGAERMRIDSSGNVGIGGTANAFSKLEVMGTLPSSGGSTVAYRVSGTFPSSTTNNAYAFGTFITNATASYTLSNMYHFAAVQDTLGAGSTVTNQFGFAVDATLTGATNNYGFYSNIASGSNRWNFYAAGTAQNYFAGNTGVGETPAANYRFWVKGADSTSSNAAIGVVNSSNTNMFYLRNDNYFNSGAINNYSVAGTTVVIDSNNFLGKTTSSLRYKKDIVNYDKGLLAISKLRPVYYKSAVEGPNGVDPKQHAGLIAEEIEAEGFEEFLIRDNDGRAESIQYPNMVALLVKAVQELKSELDALKA